MRRNLTDLELRLNHANTVIMEQRNAIIELQKREIFQVSEHVNPLERKLQDAESRLDKAFARIDEQATKLKQLKDAHGVEISEIKSTHSASKIEQELLLQNKTSQLSETIEKLEKQVSKERESGSLPGDAGSK